MPGGFKLHIPNPTEAAEQNTSGKMSRRTSRERKQPKKYGEYLQSPTKRRNTYTDVDTSGGEMEETEKSQHKPSEQNTSGKMSRRTSRERKQPKKYGEYLQSPTKRRNTYTDVDTSGGEMEDELSQQKSSEQNTSGKMPRTSRERKQSKKGEYLLSPTKRRNTYTDVDTSGGEMEETEKSQHKPSEQNTSGKMSRRTSRERKQPKKYGEYLQSPTKRRNTYTDVDTSGGEMEDELSQQKSSEQNTSGKMPRTSRERKQSKKGEYLLSPTKRRNTYTDVYTSGGEMEETESQQKPSEQNTKSRRTTRVRKQPKKYGDYLQTPTKRRNTYTDVETSGGESEDTEMSQQKPSALFTKDDVEGQDMFKFKSRHTKLDLQNKVMSAINTSQVDSPKTPKKTFVLQAMSASKLNERTPRHVKNIIKKRIIKEVASDSESDFSGGSSSDFVPDGSDHESESNSSENEASQSQSEEEPEKHKSQIVRGKTKTKPKDSEYFITPDNYFMMNSTKKITTSDHTLARLKNLNIDELESDIQISTEHKEKIAELNKSYKHLFNRWLYVLSENFNIILYGVGSKRSILHEFQMKKLKDFPCIVVNGFFPSLTIKSITETIVIDLLGNSNVPSNIGDIVNLIDAQLTESGADLFLIVHNIDGSMLKSAKAQATLASISQIKNVHLIATVDHINAPLLWDHSKLSKFKFTWWDVTTFMPYSEETSYENSLMTHRSGALQLSSLKSVYQSLTTNAKGIFNIIIEYQLENQKQAHYQGFPFKELYSKSREQFLVSSDLALRAQLTEFLDHKLVKMKRTCDGSENLVIPIETSLLQQFMEQNS